jgi:predicted ArsR family transcriptional regulator
VEFVTAPLAATETRTRVVQVLAEHGQATVPVLAGELGLTQAAVRRHLDALQLDGLVVPAPHPRPTRRGRGRPPKTFQLTESGRAGLPAAYDALAVSALQFLADGGGEAAVSAFARRRVADLVAPYPHDGSSVDIASAVDRATTLARVLTDQGYVASAEPAPGGAQVCQHHCPVAHVAQQFPQLCEAETEAFAQVLGTHVQRLATIAHGDGVCTTFVPESVTTTAATGADRPQERTSA